MRRLMAKPLVACALASCFTVLGCRSEAERRGNRISDLRGQGERGLNAVVRFCEAREEALDHYRDGEPGWEVALQEVLRASDPLTDACDAVGEPHEHDDEEPPLEGGGLRTSPPDTQLTPR